MRIRYDRPVSTSAGIAGRLGVFAATMLVVVFLAHRFGPLKTPDLIGLALVAALSAAIAVPLALVGFLRLWYAGAQGGVAAARGFLLALLPLALVGFAASRYLLLPPLYEVSTDLIDAPAWIEAPEADQQWLPAREPVTPQTREAQLIAYPALTGRRYEGALDRVYQAVLKVAGQNGFTVVQSRGQEYAISELTPALEPEEDAGLDGAPPADADGAAGAVPDVGPVPEPRPSAVPLPLAPQPGDLPGVVRLQAVKSTLVFGLPFDVLIRLREEAETTLVDMRVASRFGPHDLGLSAGMAEDYLHALDAELLGIAGD